ncbi:hypothetical protein M7I_3760 [Glarea lozoyensis 74030]|uniref:Uncharacterized protein n=1 Tax=Glarea lozoyensis (strain ATCC 74030 / MF5533) TaxID=1104152 RepID=H0EMC8_GLAL7|nr:hypothetical protein M7I_3760 [Glarea lozoyensis 74030]
MVLFTQAVHIASSAKHALDPSMFLEDLAPQKQYTHEPLGIDRFQFANPGVL